MLKFAMLLKFPILKQLQILMFFQFFVQQIVTYFELSHFASSNFEKMTMLAVKIIGNQEYMT